MTRKPTKREVAPKLVEIDKEFQKRMAHLVMMWANAESWLFRVLAVLMRTDDARAMLILSSFTSSRAKVDMIQRAGIMCLPTPPRYRYLKKMLDDFRAITKLRNWLCHSQYDLDPTETVCTGLISSNFQRGDFDGTNHLDYRTIDRGLLNEISQAQRKAAELCVRLERYVKRAPSFVLERPRESPLPLPKLRKAKGPPPRPQKAKGQKRQRKS